MGSCRLEDVESTWMISVKWEKFLFVNTLMLELGGIFLENINGLLKSGAFETRVGQLYGINCIT